MVSSRLWGWDLSIAVSLILGQMNFFMEFDVCFFRSQFEFEVNPKAPGGTI